ncbi:carboxypeptidase regulatory-like domain-containing protein [Archangium sp.]|jgi:squalene-hopene/tetraprenyl-beta-curcumene cyclase|uniref:carboxypeptidase regulatory-like domain-containing protein n=1 Tax=Archangium sp. TaxID=1872627 RepID=UPI002EDA4241
MARLALAALCLALSTPALAAPPTCDVQPQQVAASRGDPKAREAAHKGLGYLSRSSAEWTAQHGCFGCHVQAVTLEALTAARHHQYDVAPKDITAMVKALKLGVTAGGRVTGAAFEGSAWARYDQWVDAKFTDDLLRYAKQLVSLQATNGSLPDDDARRPVSGGTMQTTFQAAQTWRQAYARTADAKWLPPLRKAESFLTATSAKWQRASGTVYLQDVNFALLGMSASGVGRAEPGSLRLQRMLLERQNQDGGWGLDKGKSDAFATGQTVYALKLAGYSDSDAPISRAMRYLVQHQHPTGAWRTYTSGQGGAEKAETMWAVLGLVTVDVASIAVNGLVDGQHVTDTMNIQVQAMDNQSGGIAKLELLVDDLPVHSACGGKLTYAWNTSGLKDGKHALDVVATNAKGLTSKRRFEVFAGNVFMTQVGANFDEASQRTLITLRNLADPSAGGAIELEVWEVGEGSEAKPKAKVFSTSRKGEIGAVEFAWDGKGNDGKAKPRGRYLARLAYRDARGQVLQTESSLFFHDSESVQRQKYGEIEGQLSLKGGQGQSANTVMELVDDQGRVVQSTVTTEQGNYRFKNVDKGQYRVRAKKEGFRDLEQPVAAEPAAAPSKAIMTW